MSTPIKFKQLTLRNFMSYGNNETVINLDFNEPTLIKGKNYDAVVEGQIDSNGSGKSAILDALSFCLYDKTISNKDKSKLINNINKKNLEVSVTFEKNGITYKVIRMRKTKTKADVQLLVKNKDGEYIDRTPDSISNTNAELEQIMGLPFEVFARIVVYSASFDAFLDLPSRHTTKTSQTSIMEELFGYTELTEKANDLKEQIKGVKYEFAHLTELQEQIGKEKERHKNLIVVAKERISNWETEQKEKGETYKKELSELSKIDIEGEREILTVIDEFDTEKTNLLSDKRVISSELDNLEDKLSSFEEQEAKIKKIREKVKTIESNIDFAKETEIIEKIDTAKIDSKEQYDLCRLHNNKILESTALIMNKEEEIDHLESDTCPYCKQTFKDSASKLKDLNKEVKDLNKEVKDLNKEVEDLNKEVKDVEDSIESMIKKSIFKGSSRDLESIKSDYKTYMVQIESYNESSLDDNIDGQIEDKKDAIEVLKGNIQDIQDKIESTQSKSSFRNIGEVERCAAQIESLTEKIKRVTLDTNPHIDALTELENVTFDDNKSDKINELDNTLVHQEFLLKLLTKKDSFIRKNLLDRSLPFLNNRLLVYLEKLGLPHRVEFKGDMSAQISQFGTELDFNSLSSGQRARVNLGLAFAFRDVLQARHGKISFCMLDECLDTGLGNVGVQLAAKMIKDIAIEEKMSMFIISHRDEISSMFNKQMVVELRNGFSTIVN